MMFRETIDLVTLTTTQVKGLPVSSETKTTVFADLDKIGMLEYYQANAQKIKLEKSFLVRTIDYTDQTLLDWNSSRYLIERTQNLPNELTKLICSKVRR